MTNLALGTNDYSSIKSSLGENSCFANRFSNGFETDYPHSMDTTENANINVSSDESSQETIEVLGHSSNKHKSDILLKKESMSLNLNQAPSEKKQRTRAFSYLNHNSDLVDILTPSFDNYHLKSADIDKCFFDVNILNSELFRNSPIFTPNLTARSPIFSPLLTPHLNSPSFTKLFTALSPDPLINNTVTSSLLDSPVDRSTQNLPQVAAIKDAHHEEKSKETSERSKITTDVQNDAIEKTIEKTIDSSGSKSDISNSSDDRSDDNGLDKSDQINKAITQSPPVSLTSESIVTMSQPVNDFANPIRISETTNIRSNNLVNEVPIVQSSINHFEHPNTFASAPFVNRIAYMQTYNPIPTYNLPQASLPIGANEQLMRANQFQTIQSNAMFNRNSHPTNFAINPIYKDSNGQLSRYTSPRRNSLEESIECDSGKRVEDKKAKNRAAALRCRQRKQERVKALEEQVIILSNENRKLRELIMFHTSNGCNLIDVNCRSQ